MMNKRICLFLLTFALLLSAVVPASAAGQEEVLEEMPVVESVPVRELSLSTVEDFLAFAEDCRLDSFSENLIVSLEADIDLQGVPFQGVPIFQGTLQGNGHTISGLSITADGSQLGLFRYLTQAAVVEDLTVEAVISPEGSRSGIGGIAGSNAGTIQNCIFRGTVVGGDYVGGIAGRNTVTGRIQNCQMWGQVTGDHFAGGIVGENSGVIRQSVNRAAINTTSQENMVELSQITLETITSSESANTTTDMGGIAGISLGVIRDCRNQADVGYPHMGYNVGGIAGTQAGYIANCRNHGNVQGRKEVGGIAGQMEPVTVIEFTQDTLQILQEQLNTMSGLVNRASGNAQGNASQITGQIGAMQSKTEKALEAVGTLFPDADNPGFPDQDTILAARNVISSSLGSMPGIMRNIASATQATVGGLMSDLNAISNQIGAMGETLNNGAEYLGGTITDISDQDVPELQTGKIEGCINYGSVLADLNAGGIAGAMAIENDMDIWEDWKQSGELSLNFDSQVRAVILECKNIGVVTGKKQNIGGIAGWQSLGLVKQCTNTGLVDGQGAEYAGGISGRSSGFIRENYARCEVYAEKYLGGIAGSGTVATGSLAQVRLQGGKEKIGAILGWVEETDVQQEAPVSENYYLPVGQDPGAIDGISYAGKAEPKALEAFLDLENLPAVFQKAVVSFCIDGKTVADVYIVPGNALPLDKIPIIPEKNGSAGHWTGLHETDLECILFDLRFDAEYDVHSMVIGSTQHWKDGRPVALLEGSFTSAAALDAEPIQTQLTLARDAQLLEAWNITATEAGHTLHLMLPEGTSVENLQVLVSTQGEAWQETAFHQDGSYLVFDMDSAEAQVAIVQSAAISWLWILVGAGGLLILLTAVCLYLRKHKDNKKA